MSRGCPLSPRYGRLAGTAFALGVGLAMAGCGTTSLSQSLGVAVGATAHPEPPVEIYSRIAKGALNCWFGPQGSLKRTHVFHADVSPPSAGGAAEIVIHERDMAAASPRSLRFYRISITPAGEGSTVQIENLRFPEAVAKDLVADVVRWAGGGTECSVIGVGGWNAKPQTAAEIAAAQAEAAKTVKQKVKKKP
ncbi:MAG: hypothetical protein ACKVP7_13065 [Hyphomicrobiaceae bacterium]